MLRIFTYQLPYKKPFKTAGHEFTYREGLILNYSESGIEAFGEVAPLPGFSEESLDQVREILILNREHLEQALSNGEAEAFIQMLDQIHQCPSLTFGLDVLNSDLQAKKEGLSLPDFLFKEKGYRSEVESNAVLPISGKEETLDQANRLVGKGFRTLKIKVGRNFTLENEILIALRDAFPSINIRIDANQSWQTEEAIHNLQSLNALNIEYCEQPVPASDIKALREVREQVNIPIAADESARNKNTIVELIEDKAADLIIVKPMLLGSLQNIYVTNQLANTHGIGIVCTTSLETAVGRSAIAAIASGIASKNKAQGLSTGSLFNYDVGVENWLNSPVVQFPKQPGLGVSVHLNKLKELT